MQYLRLLVASAMLSGVSLIPCFAQVALAGYKYIKFDFPGATATEARGINDVGQIVGWYADGAGKHH